MSGILRRGLLSLVLLPSLGLAGAACTSSKGEGSPGTSTAAAGPSALPTAIPALPATPPASAPALAAFLQQGLALTGSAHLDFRTGLAGTSLTGQGVALLAGGEVTGLDVRAAVTDVGNVHLLFTGGAGYAALPQPTEPGKPYALIGGSAGGPQLDRTAIALQATELLAAPATYRTLVAAAQGLSRLANDEVGATPVLHYRGTVSVAKIPTSDPVSLALTALGVTSLDLQVWVDGQGRPLKVAAPAPDGRVSDVTFTDINHPVRVSAPPPAQVDR